MKRQVAIIGPTPEFVRWSVRHNCPMRADTDIASVDGTEKRLRALHTAGLAVQTGIVHEGIAVRRDQNGDWLGFRIDDVFGCWGGYESVQSLCAICPANLPQSKNLDGGNPRGMVAGCFGWLTTDGDQNDWRRAVEQSWPGDSRSFSIRTNPHWYSLWADRTLSEGRIEHAIDLFRNVSDSGPLQLRPAAMNFRDMLENCHRHGLNIDVELVPAGFSDGITWTIGRHCDRCRAPFDDSWKGCRVCQKQGGSHPEIKKRVLGLRPWVSLTRVIGKVNLKDFLLKARLDRTL